MRVMIKFGLFFLLLSVMGNGTLTAQNIPQIKAEISVSPEMRNVFIKGGRLILRLTKIRGKESRKVAELTIGGTALNWDIKSPFQFSSVDKNV